ncbi:hypothetical protein C0Q70_08059 [Pomacea canaliculata]|uniref:Uncharacterized protein n=1 Tax=Pomacea canaliculata TaxID=400727 RepID=A0A2T7PGT8_POMCA|nr:hypothetical protein C0Q70_08059 [Pomacea canaliculata]
MFSVTHQLRCSDWQGVNGLRLAYGYYPGWGVDDHCQETGGNHEFTQLCMKMLKKIGMHHKGIYGAMVNNATCGHIDEERYLLKMSERSREKKISNQHGLGRKDAEKEGEVRRRKEREKWESCVKAKADSLGLCARRVPRRYGLLQLGFEQH